MEEDNWHNLDCLADYADTNLMGGAVQVDPGFSQLTPRLLSSVETEL